MCANENEHHSEVLWLILTECACRQQNNRLAGTNLSSILWNQFYVDLLQEYVDTCTLSPN